MVTFSDLSTGMVASWSWDFGDTNTSTEQNPVNTYTAAGTYTVSLTATGPGGSDTETKVDYIVVDAEPPVAEFSGSPTAQDCVDGRLDKLIVDGNLQLHFAQQIHRDLVAPVHLGLTFLTSESLAIHHGQAKHFYFRQRRLDGL